MAALFDKLRRQGVPFRQSTVSVGRSPDNDFVVNGREVSRHHCLLKRGLFGQWSLKQLGAKSVTDPSFNCSFVKRGGEIITVVPGRRGCALQDQDELAFGRKRDEEEQDFRFVFHKG